MAVLDPVVGPAADLLFFLVAQVFHRRAVGSKAVSRDCFRQAMPLQRVLHKVQCSVFIAGPGDIAFQDFALLIDRPPEINHLAIELHVAS